jgi:hypothetical protein
MREREGGGGGRRRREEGGRRRKGRGCPPLNRIRLRGSHWGIHWGVRIPCDGEGTHVEDLEG